MSGTQYSFSKRRLFIAVCSVFVVMAGLWFWKVLEVKSLAGSNQLRQRQLVDNSNKRIEQQARFLLLLMEKPLARTVTTGMIKGAIHQADLYDNDIVKPGNTFSVMIINRTGKIISSTHHEYEGRNYTSIGAPYFINENHTVLDRVSDSVLVMSSPLTGPGGRIGTLVVNYTFTGITTPSIH